MVMKEFTLALDNGAGKGEAGTVLRQAVRETCCFCIGCVLQSGIFVDKLDEASSGDGCSLDNQESLPGSSVSTYIQEQEVSGFSPRFCLLPDFLLLPPSSLL